MSLDVSAGGAFVAGFSMLFVGSVPPGPGLGRR